MPQGKFSASNESFVALVDGGSNGEVAPLQPLIVKARGVDTIFAIDSVSHLCHKQNTFQITDQ